MQPFLIETIHILIHAILLDYKDLSPQLQNPIQILGTQFTEAQA
jgi:hypothetical protein